MKIKAIEMNGKTYAEVLDGKPIFVHDDGKEVPFDAPATVQTLNRTLDESKKYKERAQAAEAKNKAWEEVGGTPEEAKEGISLKKNIKDGELINAGKVEETKAALKKAAEEQVAAARKGDLEKLAVTEKERDQLRTDLYNEKIGGSFLRSKFIAEKAAVPAAMMRDTFGPAFKVEDGKTIAYDPVGNKLYSRIKVGELAEFDEALEMLVDAYPYRDQILKGANQSGSGARPGAGTNGSGGKRTITRDEFNKLDPVAQGKAAYGKDAMTIVD